jgi:hypothetical protein
MDEARRDRVDANPLWTVLRRHCPCEADDRALRRAVGDRPVTAAESRYRRDVDDRTAAAVPHVRYGEPRREQHRRDVDAEALVPRGQVDVDDGARGAADSDVVDQNVDATPRLRHRFDGSLRRCRVRDIRDQWEAFARALVDELARLLQVVHREIDRRHASAGSCKRDGYCLSVSDAGRARSGTGDDRDSPCEAGAFQLAS